MALSERELAILRVLADSSEPIWPGRIGVLAGFDKPHGATATLDALRRKGWVIGTYGHSTLYGDDTSRRWTITAAGREALGAFAFGEM